MANLTQSRRLGRFSPQLRRLLRGENIFARTLQPTGCGDYVRRRVVSRLLNTRCAPGATVLDMGAGEGNLLTALRPVLRQRYVSLDIESGRHGQRLVADLRASPVASRSVGCVCMSDVLEHAPDEADLIGEAARVLQPNGYLVIHVPSLRQKPAAFLRRAADAAEHIDDQRFPHVRDGYSQESLRDMLGRFDVLEIESISPSFSGLQSLISDYDGYLWWKGWSVLRVVTWVAIRVAPSTKAGPGNFVSSSGLVAVLRKVRPDNDE